MRERADARRRLIIPVNRAKLYGEAGLGWAPLQGWCAVQWRSMRKRAVVTGLLNQEIVALRAIFDKSRDDPYETETPSCAAA